MSENQTILVGSSRSYEHAIDRFLEAIEDWVYCVRQEYPDGFSSDSHDGGTFMASWIPYIDVTSDEAAIQFMQDYRDQARTHFDETDQWRHGYWREQEIHHGTEHFDIFLRALWEVHPNDDETVQELEDAAEHIGNWVNDIPEWFDYETGLFRSTHVGTEFVGEPTCNLPDHIRLVSLSLLAYEMTGKERYLDLARQHGRLWADAITNHSGLPPAIDADGPIQNLEGDDEETYRSFAGAAPDDLESQLARAENLIASSHPDTLLSLWTHTGDRDFLHAAEKILDLAAQELASPIAWQVQGTIRRYRTIAHSHRYDGAVTEVNSEAFRPIKELTIVPEPEERSVERMMGMRGDKPDWLDENGDPAPSPLLIMLRGLIDKNEQLMIRALDLGLAHFQLARQVWGDVTHHGCGSRSLSAVCRGHGRLNGAGVVTEVLAPAIREGGANITRWEY